MSDVTQLYLNPLAQMSRTEITDLQRRLTRLETQELATLAEVILRSILTAKGDLITATASNTPVVKAIGTNGQLLIADSAETTGLRWGSPTASIISDFAEAAQDAVGGALVDSSTIDFTYNDGANTITAIVIDGSISNAKLRNSAALSVIGRSANTTGEVADIVAANDGEVLRRSGSSIGFGVVANAGLADMVGSRIKGRAAGAGTGAPQDLTDAQVAAIVGPATNHNTLLNLTTGDVHTHYALLAGRSGGQTLVGGVNASNNLTLSSTSHGTKGFVRIVDGSLFRLDPTQGPSPTETVVADLRDSASWATPSNGRVYSIMLGRTFDAPNRQVEFGYINNEATSGSSPAFFVRTAGSNRFFVTHQGLVGIATNGPALGLEIATGSSASSDVIRLSESADRTNRYMDIGSSVLNVVRQSGSGIPFIINTSLSSGSWGAGVTAGAIQLRPDGITTLSANRSGRVGIGTTDPQNTLHVNGTTQTNDLLVRSDSSNATWTNPQQLAIKAADSKPGLSFHADTGERLSRIHHDGTLFIVTHIADNIILGTNGLERVRVRFDGNVGINNSNPSVLLHVGAGSGAFSSPNVLIGANAAGAASIAVRNSTNSIEGSLHATTAHVSLGSITNHPLMFFTNNTERGRVSGAGIFQWDQAFRVQGGTSGSYAVVGGVKGTGTSTRSNSASGSYGNLEIHTIEANTLTTNGDSIWFEFSGVFESVVVHTKQLRFVLVGSAGTSSILDVGAVADSFTGMWTCRGRVFRDGSAQQRVTATFVCSNSALAPIATDVIGLTNSFSSDMAVHVQVLSGASNAVRLRTSIFGYDRQGP